MPIYAVVLVPAAMLVGAAIYMARVQFKAQCAVDARREQALAAACQREYELDPRYQAKVEADRQYKLAKREMRLKERLLAIPQYGGLASPELTPYVQVFPTFKPVAQIVAPEQITMQRYEQPQQELLLSALKENALVVSPGIRASTGEVVIVSIPDVPHLKIIGSTGFGKSCLAGAILDQATQLNSEDILQVALLDLEHKTSRLFEDLPHVARLKKGDRLVDMVATDADEVAEHLGILKRELDRRTRLSEDALDDEPVLLMYVEEMLSLQYEVVDPKLLARMFADLTILAVRGRKYKMFLLSVMQTDYSTKEMQITQKMFRFRSAAAVDVTAARAAGFQNTDLIKENFAEGKPGQFVVEYPSFSDIVLAPRYDVKRLVAQKSHTSGAATWEPDTDGLRIVKGHRTVDEWPVNDDENGQERASEVHSQEVVELLEKGWGKQAILEKVWRVKPGGSPRYKRAEAEYESIIQAQEGA